MTVDSTRADQMKRLQAAVEESPSSAVAHQHLGDALLKAGKGVAAEQSLRRAVELDPQRFEAWINLGGALFSRLDFTGSMEANLSAIETRPEAVQGHYNLGLSYLYLGRAEEMLACFRRVLEIEPSNPGGHYHVAVGLNARGESAAASVSLRRSQELGFAPEPELVRAIDKALGKAPIKEQGEGVLTLEIGNDPDDSVREET